VQAYAAHAGTALAFERREFLQIDVVAYAQDAVDAES